ncbi:MAG: hypothetical protein WBP26_03260 [Candidatus Saccharimonadales bacterium]
MVISPEDREESVAYFLEHFDEQCAALSVEACTVPMPDQPSKPLQDYGFVALRLSAELGHQFDSEGHFGFVEDFPEGVTFYPGQAWNRVFFDAGTAIGLTHQSRLLAVGAAGINMSGDLLIKQLQDVTGVRRFVRDPDGGSHRVRNKEYYRTGLHSGFLWRDTLVRAWRHVAEMQPSKPFVHLRSNENSPWPNVIDAGGYGYDDVAQRNGGVRYGRRNWVLPSLATAA